MLPSISKLINWIIVVGVHGGGFGEVDVGGVMVRFDVGLVGADVAGVVDRVGDDVSAGVSVGVGIGSVCLSVIVGDVSGGISVVLVFVLLLLLLVRV